MAALFKSCMLKSYIIKSHAKIKPSTVHFQIFEEPEGTPYIRKQVFTNPPSSPGTDDKKENIEDHDTMALLNTTPQSQGRSASMLFPHGLNLAASFNGGIRLPIPLHLGVVTVWAQKARFYLFNEQ